MATTIGILLFDGAEEMDFVGPWQVFAAAVADLPGERVLTVAERSAPIHCELGMRVLPDHAYADAPALDVVLVPGGSGARRELAHPATTDWLRATAARCTWVTSVCTGSFLLADAGLAAERRVGDRDVALAGRQLYGPGVVARTKDDIAYDHPRAQP